MEAQKEKLEIKLSKSNKSYKLVVEKELERKIRFLCLMKKSVEWSGVLFYKTEGSFEDDSLVVRAMDVCLMDIGNATFTSFKDTPEIAEYTIEHPELLDAYEGLIHSHNAMSTFFSATDLNTLRDNGFTQNHFVSLIINNAGTYSAAITRLIHKEVDMEAIYELTSNSYYKSFDDKTIKVDENVKSTRTKTQKFKEVYLEWSDLNIEVQKCKVVLPEIQKRLMELDVRSTTVYNSRNHNNYTQEVPLNTEKSKTTYTYNMNENHKYSKYEKVDSESNNPFLDTKPVDDNKIFDTDTYEQDKRKFNPSTYVNNMDTKIDFSIISEAFCLNTLVSALHHNFSVSNYTEEACKGYITEFNQNFSTIYSEGLEPEVLDTIATNFAAALPYVIMIYFSSIKSIWGSEISLKDVNSKALFKFYLNRMQSILENYSEDLLDYNGNFDNVFDILDIID